MHPLTGTLCKGVHLHLHGGTAYIGDDSFDHYHIVDVGCRVKLQIAYPRGGHVASAVTAGRDPCHLIDPLHQPAAKQAAVAVEVLGHEDVNLFGFGFSGCFSVHTSLFLITLCIFYYDYSILSVLKWP